MNKSIFIGYYIRFYLLQITNYFDYMYYFIIV